MKARVKATGEIVNINEFCTLYDSGERTYYWANALELITQDEPDYWTRLEHTYAGMAMQGMLNNSTLLSIVLKGLSHEELVKEIANAASNYAHALVERMKKEERK